MFLRSRSFNAKNGGQQQQQQGGGAGRGRTTIPASPLRLFRRNNNNNKKHQHRRCQSEPDANEKAVAAAAASAQIKTEPQEDILRLKRADLQMGRLLGEGGFAQVFAVERKNSLDQPPQKLALKQLRPELLKDKVMFQRAATALVQESRIMTILKGHQHILNLRGVATDATEPLPTKRGFDSFFLVTDALRETMTDRLEQWNQLPPTQERWMYQLEYALQVAKALTCCHQNRIVYRDCKVDNLGFSDEHTVQLFDFGLARELPNSTSEGQDFDDDAQTCTSSLDEHLHGDEEVFHMTICGTQRHMAPEVYNRGWYNCKADTYSWAMTVVELITGKKPYPYMSLPVHKILVLEGGGRPNLEALGFPLGLQHILKQSWASNLTQRWSMDQVCAALETYIGSECSQQQAAVMVDNTKTVPLLQDQGKANNHLDAVQQQQEAKEGGEPVLAGAA